MRVNALLFVILGIFFWLAAAVYIVWTWLIDPVGSHTDGHPEWVGTVGMALSGILSFFIAFYVSITQRAIGSALPEDRPDAAIDDGDPETGFFSPWSWWPLALAFGLALMFLGLAVGVWIAIIGAPIAAISVIGWVYEYYRGNFAR